jgi:biliverdin reductase
MRIGIIGTGGMASARAAAFHHLDGVEVAWACSRTEESAARFAEQNGICGIAGWESAVTRDDAEAVFICTPNATHYPIAKAALEAGKHVGVEYGFTNDAEQARELVTLAGRGNCSLHVGLTFRLSGLHRAVKRELATLGRVATVYRLQCSGRPISKWYSDKELTRAVFFSSTIEMIDSMRDLIGEAAWVDAGLEEWLSDERTIARDSGPVMLGFRDGGVALLNFARGWPSPGVSPILTVIASEGYLELRGERLVRSDPTGSREVVADEVDAVGEDSRAFVDLIGGRPVPYTAKDAAQSVAVAEAALESATAGHRVQLG